MLRGINLPPITLVPVAVALALVPAIPEHAVAQSDGGLLKSDLVRMMTADNYSSQEVLQIVRMNCVGFAPSARDRSDLARLFDGNALLDEIDRCRSSDQSAGYRDGIPIARPVAAVERPIPSQPPDLAIESPEFAPDPADAPSLARPPLGAPATVQSLPGVSVNTPPRLLNWDYVTRRIRTEYRPDRRHSGEVKLRIWVDENGRAGEASILDAEGDPALARVTLAAVPLMRFAPAESRDRRVGAWATLPIRFQAD